MLLVRSVCYRNSPTSISLKTPLLCFSVTPDLCHKQKEKTNPLPTVTTAGLNTSHLCSHSVHNCVLLGATLSLIMCYIYSAHPLLTVSSVQSVHSCM